ncbi:DUF2752 domain-containing protein [Mucilaginibacter sp. RS28]|uniref:DUF2752 domain-containing protein n=1 Tax=Mucilaginibacter straminoryzae TaxID=2932774 RepID=A0A9X1X635_9SPHI|nr:DUF2752 domain-containing protein [Mucilaginibacter straminoryzae]MCJ8211734.1 DUF2752 domain-containing protein [Mucilaginibacter straminoryzae]
MRKLFNQYSELVFWLMAIIALGVTNPGDNGHFSLCPLKLAGFTWCPGCGIGHAISWLLHGNLHNSFKAHWLGMPALGVILVRICNLFGLHFSKFKSIT